MFFDFFQCPLSAPITVHVLPSRGHLALHAIEKRSVQVLKSRLPERLPDQPDVLGRRQRMTGATGPATATFANLV